MKKLINCPEELVNDTLLGYTMANKNIVELVPDSHMVVRKQKKEKGKVKFVLGNGAGHEPAVIGWVGPGMLDMNV
ncbi:MAG: dihydroxyacetone kinase subunit DhaK, partial [Clostridiales bacterium]|nr:dihydroxyacetone kinase subunit DhaK [Clostridiales bacterium]